MGSPGTVALAIRCLAPLKMGPPGFEPGTKEL